MIRAFAFGVFVALCATLFPFSAPVQARGTLIKGSLPAVYYVAPDGKRYVFPNERIYRSWYADFSTVQTVSDAALAKYAIGGNVTYRPGTRLVKLLTDPKVYALEAGGVLRWVQTESVAQSLYGLQWAKRVDDLSDAFFPAYRIGEPLSVARYPEGTVLQDVNDQTYYVIWGNTRRALTGDAFTKNGYQSSDAILADTSSYPLGASISGELALFSDTAQTSSIARQTTDIHIETQTSAPSIFQGASAQSLGVFTFSVKQSVTIRSLAVDVIAQTNASNDKDAGGLLRGDGSKNIEPVFSRLYFVDETGQRVLNTASLVVSDSGDGKQRVLFDGTLVLAAGRHTLTLVGDVAAEATLKERYAVTIQASSSSFVVPDTDVASVAPNSLTGTTVTVEDVGVTLKKSGGVKSLFVPHGQTGPYTAMGFSLENPSSHAWTVREFTATGYIDEGEGNADFVAGADADNGAATSVRDLVTSVVFVDASGAVLATPATIGSDGTVRVQNLSWTIPANGMLNVFVRVGISAEAPFEQGTDRLSFDIANPQEDISVVDANGIKVDVLGASVNGKTNPSTLLRVAQGGQLIISGSSQSPARYPMGTEQSVLSLQLEADEVEDISVTSLAMRIIDAEAIRSLGGARLTWSDASGSHSVNGTLSVGTYVFRPTDLLIPADTKVPLSIRFTTGTVSTGAVSGDDLGFVFEPSVFTAVGVQSGYTYDVDDIGTLVVNTTTAGGTSPVRKNIPSVTRSSTQPSSVSKSEVTPLLRFKASSTGVGTSEISKLTFKIISSDAGTRLNNADEDNDLLEFLADVNGDESNDDGIVELENLTSGDILGEGSAGSIDYAIYNADTRKIDETPAGYNTTRADYGLVTYVFRQPIQLTTESQEFEFRLHTRGLAIGQSSVKVVLLGGDDFVWSDGTFDGDTETGTGITQLPVTGLELGF